MEMNERGCNPEDLSRSQLLSFYDEGLSDFLAGQGVTLPVKVSRRLRSSMASYDPRHATPYEFMERLSASLSD
jgi:hypothetical protein